MNQIFMIEALKLAKKAFNKAEVPVGCVIVKEGKIIGKGYNNRENKNDICGHAEIIAIRKAAKKIKSWKLNECDLYVTLKPCSMCESAIKQSRIANVYYILEKDSSKIEYYKTNFNEMSELSQEYKSILNNFFKIKR